MVAPSSNRKMLAAREDLADKLSEIAAKRGFTLFGLVNELLETTIKVDSMGISFKEAVDAYELTKEVRDASYTLVLESLIYDTADLAYEQAGERALKTWFDAGVWAARRYIAHGVEDPLSAYERELKLFNWNVSGANVERNGKKVSIRIFSPRFTKNFTILFNRYLNGVVVGCGYEVTLNEVGRGNIRLEASLKGDGTASGGR